MKELKCVPEHLSLRQGRLLMYSIVFLLEFINVYGVAFNGAEPRKIKYLFRVSK